MPRVAGDDAVIVISSSSEEERGEGRRRSTSSVRPCHHSAAAAGSVSGNHMDGEKKKKNKKKNKNKKKKKKKKRKEGEGETATAASEGVRRGGEESRAVSEAKVKKRKKTEENKEKKKVKKATFHSSSAGGVVAASDGVGGRSPTRSFPMNRAEGLAGGSEGMGGVAKKGKKRKEEIGKGGEAGEAQKTEEKKKRKKNEEEKEKKATFPSSYAKDVVAANGVVGSRSTAGGEVMDGVRRKGNKKKKDRDEETGTVAGGEVPSGVGETKKKKRQEAEKKEKEATSPVSYARDVVATSNENGCPSPTCSFPMRRVKRLIAGSEGGGGNSGSGNLRTTLDAVFLINKATELFLERFALDAYAHATEEHKRSVFYKHLSSTVGNEKRYEFLSDFVPEKVKAADALRALAEQP